MLLYKTSLKEETWLYKNLTEFEISELVDWRDPEGSTVLHLASSSGKSNLLAELLELGLNPEAKDYRGRTSYHLAKNKPTRDAFRLFRGKFPEKWNYNRAGIPTPLTEEVRKQQEEAAKERRRRKRAKQKANRKKKNLDNTTVETEESKKMKTTGIPCAGCSEDMGKLPENEWLFKLEFIYCSVDCITKHKRQLMADAAAKRLR